MVGIILASHGEFAKGIMQSGSMIFGEQENVAAVTLMPSEGPDDFRAKLKEAIASFDSQEEVLILADLWGGTPFNQSNTLFEEHKDKWAIVSGMNLPMLIEAYGARLATESAQEIAAQILNWGREGVKVIHLSLGAIKNREHGYEEEWKIKPEEIGNAILKLVDMPENLLFSDINLRPQAPKQLEIEGIELMQYK